VTDEQPPSQLETSTIPPPVSETRAVAPAPTRRGGCVGRFLAALLVVIITTFLTLVAGAAGLLYLGLTPAMPRQLAEAQAQIATLQMQNGSLQTQVAAHEQRGATDHEVLGDLKRQVDDIADLRDQLRQERENSAAQSATLVAEVRDGRDSVALFATAEAGRAALLSELERRSARVERFLQRLGDIANDTALDLAGTTPTVPTLPPTDVVVPTPALSPTPIATPEPTLTPVPSATSSPRATTTPTRSASATPRANSTPTRSPSATAAASPTSAPTATPSP
jgi:hypothetical protein